MPRPIGLHTRAAFLAVLAVVVLALWTASEPSARPAHADTTGVAVIGCEFIASAVDGNVTDFTTDSDIAAACGRDGTPLPAVSQPTVGASEASFAVACANGLDDDADGIINDGCPQSIQNFASAIGDKDGALERSDFNDESFNQAWDDNQISTNCHFGAANHVSAQNDFLYGLACTLDVFTFVERREPVSIDEPPGLIVLENGQQDFTCNHDFAPTGNAVSPMASDNDCGFPAPALNSDGVVLFHVQLDPAAVPSPGAALLSRVSQSSVEQDVKVNVVGPATNVALSLAENRIETNGSTSNANACETETPVTDAIDPPTSTLARATVKDAGNRILTRVPVYFTVPSGQTEIAQVGFGDAFEGVTSNTFFSIDPTAPAEPIASSAVICAGKLTGLTSIDALVFLQDCSTTCGTAAASVHSAQQLTVGGPPAHIDLAAAPDHILCDGISTTTITATITDSIGAPVADGVPVHFNVSLVGIVSPIDTVTSAGTASTTFHGLSAFTVGVPITTIAGNAGIATPVQNAILLPCNGFDTDGDGLPNAFESGNGCLNPSLSDSGGDPDLDGLSSLDEFGRGTGPCVGDSDNDGYNDGSEVTLAENHLAYCAIMRADVDGDHAVSILDLTTVAQHYLQSIPPAPARLNQDGDTKISILDIATMSNVFFQHTADCP